MTTATKTFRTLQAGDVTRQYPGGIADETRMAEAVADEYANAMTTNKRTPVAISVTVSVEVSELVEKKQGEM